ncbi:SCP2 sterol-binding domain-containing protein [Effusibacillus consociatus]|uniref:SCP2 sterol-binding domain-containing protein n=1 Tax=Effusibacillus consociatus TaxID=1117041 RepID=A0ABV9Q102_9BACL
MSVQEVFSTLTEKMNTVPNGIAGVNTVYQFDLSGDQGGTYQLKIEDGKAEYVQGTSFDAKCSLQMSDESFLKLMKGKLNPTMAFMTGKLKINGDVGLAMKLQSILQKYQ